MEKNKNGLQATNLIQKFKLKCANCVLTLSRTGKHFMYLTCSILHKVDSFV